MSTETIERPRVGGPGDDLGGNWHVIVLNDNHRPVANTGGADGFGATAPA